MNRPLRRHPGQRRSSKTWLAYSSLLFFAACLAFGASVSADGPLRVLASNPRYFTDGSGRAILLAGSHNWHNFQDNGHRLSLSGDPPPQFDYEGYLAFLQAHHHNFFRLWRWEAPEWTDAQPKGMVKYCEPHPWLRTGPGRARDGKPKFDLSRFNPAYFDRLRQRVNAAGDRGIYVSIMLFEGWAPQFTDAWQFHPFSASNNVNGIAAVADGAGHAGEYFMRGKDPMSERVWELQTAYLRQVVDAVNDRDNVLYEVCNEAGAYSTEWQYEIIRFIKSYEAGKPKQHPVGMTFQYKTGSNATLFASPADWVSPNSGGPDEDYRYNPSSAFRGKVIINDTDHLLGHTGGDNVWVWKSFCRGLNVLFMEELSPSPTWQDSARDAMGEVRRWAERIDLAAMTPKDDLAQTGYCLAEAGREYLIFQPGDQGEFKVNLADAPGVFSVEWINVNRDAVLAAKPVEGGAWRTFTTPFGGPAALHLKRH